MKHHEPEHKPIIGPPNASIVFKYQCQCGAAFDTDKALQLHVKLRGGETE